MITFYILNYSKLVCKSQIVLGFWYLVVLNKGGNYVAIYRNVSLSFWEDNKIVDDFTPEDRYFLLYLLTNPHTNLIGCYEISKKQMSNELGLSLDKVEELLTRMEKVHKIILYASETKEILIKNWHKYNWTKSEKLRKPIKQNIKNIKSTELKQYMVSIGYAYGMDTTDAVPVTDTVSDTDKNIFNIIEENFSRTLSPLEYEEIHSWIQDNISIELIEYATKIAVLNNACSIKYISRILESWKKKKITTVEQAKEENKKFGDKKNTDDKDLKKIERDRWENE